MFESFSAGVLAIFAGMVAVLVVVSLYVIFVWPLTFWDLADSGLERFGPWVNPVLAGVFLVGSGVGYFLFSGAAFKRRAQARTAVPMRTRR